MSIPRICIYCIILVLLAFSFIRCANPVSPEGGPKDQAPPKVISSFPPNNSINFNKKEIRITFDEFIQLKDANNQVTVSPPPKINPDLKVRGKTLFITLADSILPNTTYSIGFGDAIEDITEGNAYRNFRFVFSTGTFIDSLSVKGKVINAFDASPQKDILALLYGDTNDTLSIDSLPFHVRALYLSKTGEDGSFDLENVRTGKLLLFALKDQNGNGIFDLPNEKIAFCDSLISGLYVAPALPDTSKKDTTVRKTAQVKKDSLTSASAHVPFYSLRLFEQIDSVQRILKASMAQQDQLIVFFRFPTLNPRFHPLNFSPDPDWKTEEFNTGRDTVTLWLKPGLQDSLILEISDRDKIIDTLKITTQDHSKKIRKEKKGQESPRRILLTSGAARESKFNQFRGNPQVMFSFPLVKADLSRVLLVSGKDTLHPAAAFADSLKRKLGITYKWQEDKTYRLIFPDSIFTSFNNLTNDSVILAFRTELLRDLGSIRIRLTDSTASPSRIIQLLNEKESVLDQKLLTGNGKISFDYLRPGKYKIKCIIDRNHNGRWDTGNYREKLQPEEVYYFPNLIEVRSNWDIEELWNPEKKTP